MKLLTDYLQPGTVYFRNRTFEPTEIMAGIDAVARYLSDNLTSQSPFIYLFASNHVKTVLAFFGIIKARRICVVVDPGIGRLELQEMMQDTPPAACIRIDDAAISWDFSREIEIRSTVWADDSSEDLSDVCMMMYTAADDGYAKAAMLTHENLASNAVSIAAGNQVNADSLSMAALPFSHAFGLQTGVITPLLSGGDSILVDNKDLVKARNIVEMLMSFAVTHFYSIPAIFYIIGKILSQHKTIRTVQSFISGGYALPDTIRDRFLDSYGICIRQGYGLTEASPVCSWVFYDAPARTKSIGKPISCCEMRVIQNNKSDCAKSETEEIALRGTNVMKGYYRKREATERVLRDGWLFTGDLGYMDNEGYFYLTGTNKRMINYGGVKIYPAEVERLMKMNENVISAAFYAEKDPLMYERVSSNIILKRNSLAAESNIREWMSSNLSGCKISKQIQFNIFKK
ncbi:MAG: acyl--CoA ligase [Candidatus Latescibacteria bacterium]|nr:acyl--CoA ligase [Candidatus Latescibacterota bacterium]